MRGHMEAIAGTVACPPNSMSLFEIEQRFSRPGMSAEIRHYGWAEACESFFEPDHFHVELGLTRRGATGLRAPDQPHYQPPGTIVALPPGVQFRTRCEPSEHRSLCVMVDPAQFPHLFDGNAEAEDFIAGCQDVRDPRVERCLTRLLEEVRNPGFASQVLIEALISVLIVEVQRHLRGRKTAALESGGKLPPWRMKQLKERIEADLGQTLTIEALAKDVGISARHLIRTFKNTEGTTLSDYIAALRIDRARRRLGDDGVLIKQIAGECGFETSSAFSAAFRKATGETPRRFRERLRRGAWTDWSRRPALCG